MPNGGARQGPEIWIRGPVSPPEGNVRDSRSARYPQEGYGPGHVHGTHRHFSWVATHGGAGTSTLAAVYGGRDCGRDWPGPDDPQSVLLVARTHAAGLDAVLRTLEVFRLGEAPVGLDLDSVVLVADAPGRLPRPLAQRVARIESAVDVHRVPWVAAWRVGDLGGEPPRETRTLIRLTEYSCTCM
ncbi:hypothetical protein FNH09_04880 [Streptomyces adustus]|uniref:Uncharacterized protein n=1 Tax=Streptomyces adustus TaxID=1609272 RepID=A0A5N8V9I2_9ACTN|nr:DUF6668 family protein [Streptomyces adustus]MPY30668.1 hypothetical protein [Streptomyces adustus]